MANQQTPVTLVVGALKSVASSVQHDRNLADAIERAILFIQATDKRIEDLNQRVSALEQQPQH